MNKKKRFHCNNVISDWPSDCKDGKKQSPINIPRISEYYTDEVVFENYNKTLTGVITKKSKFC